MARRALTSLCEVISETALRHVSAWPPASGIPLLSPSNDIDETDVLMQPFSAHSLQIATWIPYKRNTHNPPKKKHGLIRFEFRISVLLVLVPAPLWR